MKTLELAKLCEIDGGMCTDESTPSTNVEDRRGFWGRVRSLSYDLVFMASR